MAPISKIVISALALFLASPALSAPVNTNALSVRQLAGEGAAANSILSSTDNGVGYGIEDAEDNTANTISSVTGQGGNASPGGGSGSPPPPPPPPHRRQADKIANGAAAILNAAGAPAAGSAVQTNGDSVDGELTSGAANAGAQVGSTEESTLEASSTTISE